jgi:hypothetical protein
MLPACMVASIPPHARHKSDITGHLFSRASIAPRALTTAMWALPLHVDIGSYVASVSPGGLPCAVAAFGEVRPVGRGLYRE